MKIGDKIIIISCHDNTGRFEKIPVGKKAIIVSPSEFVEWKWEVNCDKRNGIYTRWFLNEDEMRLVKPQLVFNFMSE